MTKRARVIGITGGSGSGKTFVIEALRKTFGHDELAVFSQDNYYRRREEQLEDPEGKRNFDLPEAFEMDAFCADLKQLIEGKVVERVEYTYNNEKQVGGTMITQPAPVILVEGLFIMHMPEIRSLLDFSVYVSVSDVLKLKRRIIRDKRFRNYPLEDVLYRYEYHVLPAYLQYIKPYKSKVNVIINNNEKIEAALDMLKRYIRGIIESPE